MDAYLDALAFPLILLSKLLGGHKPNSYEVLFSVALEVVCCDILVDERIDIVIFEVGQPHHPSLYLVI
jgi:hypothetical protein